MMTNGLKHITVEESTSVQWVKSSFLPLKMDTTCNHYGRTELIFVYFNYSLGEEESSLKSKLSFKSGLEDK